MMSPAQRCWTAIALVGLGCAGPDGGDVPGTGDASDSGELGREDSGGAVRDASLELVPPSADDAHPLFREDVVHALALRLSDASWDALAADGGTYVVATFSDGQEQLEVGVRIKGWTSSQPLTGKPSLKIDIDRFVAGQRYHGLEAFDLHAELTDAAALSEWAAYRLFRDQGLPASRTGWAHVQLNDMDYGFYTIVEKKDDQLIAEWWDDRTGSLYESSSEAWPCDLDNPGCACFEVDELGSGDSRADLEALCDVASGAGDDAWFGAIQQHVPWDEFTGFMATEIAIGAHDHYAGFSGNFYLYHQPSDGQWSFIPSSMNNQFGTSRSSAPSCGAVEYTLDDYRHGILASRCQADPDCLDSLHAALRDVSAHLAGGALVADIGAVSALIRPYVSTDPRTPWTVDQFDGQVACIQTWLTARPADLVADLPEDCLGEGADLMVTGWGTLSSNQRCDRATPEAPTYAVVSVAGDLVTLGADAVGIGVGDEVLVAVMQAADPAAVGQLALGEVVSVDGAVVGLADGLGAGLESVAAGGAMTLQRVPQFGDVYVGPGGVLTTSGWDGQTGGVLAFRATGAVQVDAGGRISMDGRGYRGGATGPSGNTDGYQGESLTGDGGGGGTPGEGYNAAGGWWAANLAGGGALVSGGGGEHAGGATAGESWNGDAAAPQPGAVVGDAQLEQVLMGSGGGGVAQIYDAYGPGGAGGGLVLIWADSVVVDGAVSASGEDAPSWTRGTWTYGAGGGAGGSMWVVADTIDVVAGGLRATGGAGYADVDRPGGDGGVGRIRVDCATVNGAACDGADWGGVGVPDVGWVGR